MPLPWIVKYRPRIASDLVNQAEAVKQLKDYITGYSSQRKHAVLLYGPPGTGKTSIVHALGRDLGLEVVEVNASDFRNAVKIDAVVGQASKQMSLFAKGKLILVDEVDGLSGNQDRGGVQALMQLMKGSAHPLVLTAHDPYEQKLSKLRQQCMLLEFAHLSYSDVYAKLASICEQEGISFDEHALKSLSRRSGGDLRAATNDLQSLTEVKKELRKEDLEHLPDREQAMSVSDALLRIFKTSDVSIALASLDNVDEDLDQIALWIDENLPKEYRNPSDLVRAYEHLSRGDVFKGRIRRWQHWRFLAYMAAHLTAGVATAKDEKNREQVQYTRAGRLLKIWMANQRYAKRKAIAEKVALHTHTSLKVAIRDTLPYLQAAVKGTDESAVMISDELELSADEIAWLKR
jgi:replication factor C large subunit